jgi:hypothetical protein
MPMLTRRAFLVVTASSPLVLVLAAAPPKTVNVTVIKTDGSTVRGQLNSFDLKGVSIQKLVKNQPTGEQVTIAWSEIKSISNGLTRQRAI